jgi:probable HAF family extracellular repeat protein
MSIYTYATLDDPSAAVVDGYRDVTVVQGINDSGQIVGYYFAGSFGVYKVHGFVYSNGVYTSIDDPFDGPSTGNQGGTFATGINNAGQIVGYYNSYLYAPTNYGFLETNNLYAPIIDPLATHGTVATGINDLGQIVGTYTTLSGVYSTNHGFLLSGGNYFTIDEPSGNGINTTVAGINNAGQIIGSYTTGNILTSTSTHGFLFSGGNYTTLDDPLATNGTFATGINNEGQIVGYYMDTSGGSHGFVYSNGVYTSIDDPLAGSNGTQPFGINDHDQIVGTYFDSSNHSHGFLLTITPDTPAAPTDSAVVNGYVNAAHDTASQKLTGTADNGSTVTVYDNGNFVGSTTADASTGSWSLPIGQLPDAGAHGYTVTATDADGNVSQPSAALNFLVDTTPPSITIIQKLANDTGISHTDLITSDGHVSLSGTVFDTNGVWNVEVFDGKIDLGAAQISNGAWTFPTVLGEGTHSLYAVATDDAGNTTTTPTQPTIVVDQTPPIPFMSDAIKDANDSLTTLSGMSEADSEVSVYDGSKLLGMVTADSSGNWSLQANIAGNTIHQFTETATDLAGNTGPSAGVTVYSPSTNKSLVGGSGNDFLIAGPKDTLTGGAGNDTFVFNSNFGKDVVTDFDVNHDVLALSHTLFANDTIAHVLSQTHDTTAGAVIAVDAHDAITLHGITTAQLAAHPSDFHFF